ncbi:transmembrane protein 179-like [Styela clava]|uniref:transmembrane protein 179-like n=1 Tax=Styela clava TaxID=7725 RepID=UPI00193AB15E|nr:transmembrane protein 179-like [Styela clava]
MNPSTTAFCIVYASTLFLSFFIVIPSGLNLTDFNKKCVLFATGEWNETTSGDHDLNISSWGKSSDCNFIMFMGIVCLFTSSLLLWKSVVFVCKGFEGSPFYSFISMIGCALITFCLFVCSFIMSLGYSAWCDLILSKPDNDKVCWKTDLGNFDDKYNVDSASFSSHLEIAEFGLWGSSLGWLVATSFSIAKVRYYHKNEELLQSLAFEKDTLIPHRLRYRRIGEEDFDSIS